MSETLAPYVVDKSEWGPGPWMTEPDRVDFVAHGFACLALRHPRHGYWCAYVGVPREHPLYGIAWDADAFPSLEGRGVNYSNVCSGAICHTPAPGMPDDVWWFGFDCGRVFELAPGLEARTRGIMGRARTHEDPLVRQLAELCPESPFKMREVYRDLPYVRCAVEHLACQLAALMPAATIASSAAETSAG